MEWQILAGVRFFLAWIVLCLHLGMVVPSDHFLLKFREFGPEAAVLGFLVISGYSIAHSISKRPDGFYKRRFLRVYPLYFAAIIFSLVPFFILGSEVELLFFKVGQPDWWTLLCNLTFLQGFLSRSIQSNGVVWTLSVEVFCYLLAPLLIKTSSQKILILFGLSGLLYIVYSYAVSNFGFPPPRNVRFGVSFLTLLWAWLLGFLYFRYRKETALKGATSI